MKTRESLVSNSSSTSFVVAFPKKPESATEVCEIMRLELGKTIDYYDHKAETGAIAARVFEDVSKGKEATLEEIAEWFSQRYYYTRHCGNIYGGDFKYGWVGRDKYYGCDEQLLNELAELCMEEDELQKEQCKKESKIVAKLEEKHGVKYPKNYAELSEKDKETFYKNRSKIFDEDKEYQKARKNHLKKSQEIYQKQHLLREKLAIIDARKFMEDNKGKYISIVSYSDNDAEFDCVMEHGDIFKGLPHVVINCH